MANKPPPGPRLVLSLRLEDVCKTEGEMREMAARIKASNAVSHAKESGDFSFVSALLRDPDHLLQQWFRDWLADFFDGAHKRPEGRPLDLGKSAQRWEAARLFVVLTVHLLLPEKEAVARLADFYSVGVGTVRDWLTKERASFGPTMWREMEERAEQECHLFWSHFHDDPGLRRLFE